MKPAWETPMPATILASFPSKSSEDTHLVLQRADAEVVCTCKGWQFHGKCWHVTKVKNELCLGQLERWLSLRIEEASDHLTDEQTSH
jgi:hypothetical protein